MPGGGTAWLEWSSDPPIAVAVLAVVVLLLAYRHLRQVADPRRRATLLGLRLLLVIGLLAVSVEPAWVTERVRAPDQVIAVLVDTSRSMARGDRWARALRFAKATAALGQTRLYGFDARLKAVDDLGTLAPTGCDSDLLGALRELAGAARPDGLAAVVVVSDGRDPRLAERPGDAVRATLATLGVPVHGIALTDHHPDIDVLEIRASPYAFVRSALPVEVDVQVDGALEGDSLVVVSLDGEAVTSRRIRPSGSAGGRGVRKTLELELQPKQIGAHVLSVAVAPLAGEATRVNNRAHVPLHVVRDRTRVLHLAGHPSWDTRFLRAHLRADPSVDLVSFYIMVGRGGGAFVRGAETSLIPFPTRQLFGPALDDFDLVVFQDFDFAPFGIERFLPRLERWVRQGGAFATLGGPEALVSGGWDRTAMQGWLPVRMAAATQGDPGWQEGALTPERTDVGARHAITRLEDDEAADRALWARLRLDGHNTRLTPRSGAAVLVQTPKGAPLLTVGEHGRGRVAVWATDSLWTWAFPAGDIAERDRVRAAYHRSLERLRGWLLRDPAYASVRARLLDDRPEPGDTVRIAVQVVGPDQRPVSGAELSLQAGALPRRGVPLPPPRKLGARTDREGRATLRWRVPHGGPWRLVVHAGEGRQATLAVAAAEASEEELRVQPAPERLAALCEAGGGRLWRDEAPDQRPPVAPDAGPVLRERQRSPLWSTSWSAAVLLLLMLGEWGLRRRWGLA